MPMLSFMRWVQDAVLGYKIWTCGRRAWIEKHSPTWPLSSWSAVCSTCVDWICQTTWSLMKVGRSVRGSTLLKMGHGKEENSGPPRGIPGNLHVHVAKTCLHTSLNQIPSRNADIYIHAESHTHIHTYRHAGNHWRVRPRRLPATLLVEFVEHGARVRWSEWNGPSLETEIAGGRTLPLLARGGPGGKEKG